MHRLKPKSLLIAVVARGGATTALGQQSWSFRATVELPPRADAGESIASFRANLTRRQIEEGAESLARAEEQMARGLKSSGDGALVVDGWETAARFPLNIYNMPGGRETIESYRNGVCIRYLSVAGCNVSSFDSRTLFGLFGEQIALTQRSMGTLERHWVDAKGRHWSEYKDDRPGRQPESARVRWSGKPGTNVVETESYYGRCGEEQGCTLVTRMIWHGSKPFERLEQLRYARDRLVRRLVATNWKPSQDTFESLLAAIPEGTRVTDARLKNLVLYDWSGAIPDAKELERMRRAGIATENGQQTGVPTWALVASSGIVLIGVGAIVALRKRATSAKARS